MRSSRHWRALLPAAVAASLLAAACGSDDPAGDAAGTGADRSASVAAGAELYAANCASCHGADLRGSTVGPSLLSIVYEPGHHPDASFRRAVAQGVPAHHWDFGAMPPLPALSTADVDAVIAFVRDRQRTEGFEPLPPGA